MSRVLGGGVTQPGDTTGRKELLDAEKMGATLYVSKVFR